MSEPPAVIEQLTPEQAAKYCQCSRSLIYQLVKLKVIPCTRVGLRRGKILLDPADLDRWKQSCRVEGEPVGPPTRHLQL